MARAMAVVLLALAAVSCGRSAPPTAPGGASPDKSPSEIVDASSDVAWLEKVAGSLTEAEKVVSWSRLGESAKDVRTQAYARLGALGTRASLAAVERIETAGKVHTLTPETIDPAAWTHPCWHFDDGEVPPLVETRGPDGKTYRILHADLFGDSDILLVCSTDPAHTTAWTRPRLTGVKVPWDITAPSLAIKGDELVFSYERQIPSPEDAAATGPVHKDQTPAAPRIEVAVSVPDVFRDTDGDGWTDIEEQRLGLDPQNPDFDGDGIVDGKDVTPNYAPPPAEESDDEAIVLNKAVFATFGLTEARYLLIVDPQCRKIQVWGYSGPIIYGHNYDDWSKADPDGGIFVGWSAELSASTAKVSISDYEGPTAAGSLTVTLEKKGDTWVVVKRTFGFVS